jgi:hypothetical protein
LSFGTPVFKEDNDENFSNHPKKMPIKKISVKHAENIPQGSNSQMSISKFSNRAAHKFQRDVSSRHGSEQSQSSMMTRVPTRDATTRLSN